MTEDEWLVSWKFKIFGKFLFSTIFQILFSVAYCTPEYMVYWSILITYWNHLGKKRKRCIMNKERNDNEAMFVSYEIFLDCMIGITFFRTICGGTVEMCSCKWSKAFFHLTLLQVLYTFKLERKCLRKY